MRILFVHDATFHYDELGQYYGTSVNNETLSRYRYLSDFVTVMIRAVPFEDGEDRNRYTKISDDYRVIPIPNLMSLRGSFSSGAKFPAGSGRSFAGTTPSCAVSRGWWA